MNGIQFPRLTKVVPIQFSNFGAERFYSPPANLALLLYQCYIIDNAR